MGSNVSTLMPTSFLSFILVLKSEDGVEMIKFMHVSCTRITTTILQGIEGGRGIIDAC